jgi:tetratricopeptide (TPR) repeat protein
MLQQNYNIMKNIFVIILFFSTSNLLSQSSLKNYLDDLRSVDEHLENAKELKRFSTADGYKEMAYLEVLKAIRLNPESSEAYSIKGELNYYKGDPYGAIEDLNHSISLGSKNGCTYLYRALSRIDLPYYHEDNNETKICADLITAKALGGCAENGGALRGSLVRCE